MRRIPSLSMVAVTLFALTACSLPPGTDGELTNSWPAMAEPKAWHPVAQECHQSFAIYLGRSGYTPADCADKHAWQTIHVGELSGAAASAAKPPEADSAGYQAAWTECDKELTSFLGGSWRDRRLRLRVSVPSVDGWAGGARWFSCEAVHFTGRGFRENSTVTGSLKGVFDTLAPLQFGCFDLPKATDAAVLTKKCDEAHNAEYAGHYRYDKSYADMKAEVAKEDDETHRKCVDVIADFAGISPSKVTGTWVWYPPEEDWNAGDKHMRCFLWLVEKSTTKSLKGAGTGWPA